MSVVANVTAYIEGMSEPTSLPTVRRRVLRDDVQDILLNHLVDGTYESGQTLAIDVLAREMGVSPTPVREALVRMEHTGLVTRVALKGYRVAPPLSPGAMAELMDARILLETEAVRRACDHLASVVPELEAVHARHRQVVAELHAQDPDPARRAASISDHFAADWKFHQTILDHCGNRYLRQLVDYLAPRIHRQRQAVGHGLTDAANAVEEHGRILDAYRAGDTDQAVAAMRDHLERVRRRAILDADEEVSAETLPDER